ncbi:hypothetical protein [Moraxella lacunata]|uniref:hypothetical protein n=1 Tax=Moraxella lacunata TaxID=477 RepID=UPI001C69A9A6|nr:hypothetical protein [Moraxella lacunata]
MPAKPMTAESRAGRDGRVRASSVATALMRGYVVASADAWHGRLARTATTQAKPRPSSWI